MKVIDPCQMTATMKILIAEDNHFYRLALKTTLTEFGYDVLAVADGQAAWDVLQREDSPKLAILDWVMPKMEGLEVCRLLRATPRHEPTYVIMLTSKDAKADIVTALHGGADDYITKPFDREELLARIRVGERIVGLQTSETVIYTFAQAVDGKSPFTSGHSERVMKHALALGERIGASSVEMDLLRRGTRLHDIGKIAVPDAILNKPGPLTHEEYATIKEHPIQGVRMVERLASVRDVIPLIRWHHERLDGKGYPDGLVGDQIPKLVRVLSVADVYDALSSDRPYRAGLPHEQCVSILRKDAAGGSLDSELVEAFCAIYPIHFARTGSGIVNAAMTNRPCG
jgi:putative two-component system response regulator